jgi:hypothetical protein
MPVYLYMGGEDYRNHFMLVRNLMAAVSPFVDRMDWKAIHHSTCAPKNAKKTSVIGKKQQDNFVDSGFCSAVSLSRDGTSNGVAKPRMKPGTMQDPAVLNGYVFLSDFISKTSVKWTAPNECLFRDDNNPDHHNKGFAAKIHPDNILECMRNTLTHLDSKCGSHHDWHNSCNKSCRAVVGMLILRRIKGIDGRVGINAQGRKSINDCLSRSNLYWPLLETVLSVYGRMPDN